MIQGEVVTINTVARDFVRDLARAGIKRVTEDGKATFHSLRKCYIRAVAESGTDLKTIMTLARHGFAQMSMEVYAQPNPGRLKDVAQAVSDRIREAEVGPACATYVARAVAGSKEDAVTPTGKESCARGHVVEVRGFEPLTCRLRTCRSPD